ncbi:SH3 domain-containing protein [Paenibacillus sonchi]|uniref:SH3 domain-containing protein n=1 Tax=Paenibacillus sonchi TaxID=373687 RepID=A0A974PAX8_9BACL|nr:SH3 domain-containing protein [Paenibacillus sonchi]QQZ59962.1 SH3 domain-containing protein [Paenibacillus sonchi]
MVKHRGIWSKCLVALVVLIVVYDVKTSGLNVRSGPGTSYPIIAQVSMGTDLVNYTPNGGGTPPISADNQEWLRNYYPNPSIGYYANAALGWSAYYNTVGPTVFNYSDAYVAKTSRVTIMYSSSCTNLSGAIKGFSANYYLQNFDPELKADTCNPNAWRLRDYQGNMESGYVNGWDLKAE